MLLKNLSINSPLLLSFDIIILTYPYVWRQIPAMLLSLVSYPNTIKMAGTLLLFILRNLPLQNGIILYMTKR
jgi:hypothetical protein